MPEAPSQTNIGRLSGLPQGNLFLSLASALGEFATWAETKPDDWIESLVKAEADANRELGEPQAMVWRQAVGRELLLMATTVPELLHQYQERIPKSLLETAPFGDATQF